MSDVMGSQPGDRIAQGFRLVRVKRFPQFPDEPAGHPHFGGMIPSDLSVAAER